ncbi:membrane-bound alkaline phosphatase-like [Ostrinia furnacalis]|uniref:membrane-bound alkaline phosphatase-like n=1 Tax=Ostrinia furnacalis TaxID=93504 RepID=UPI00103C182B|nr:membrane-bound alkaline phosphatase-like [Ostrinia furnacalis]
MLVLRVAVVLALCACAASDRYHAEPPARAAAAPAPRQAELTKAYWYDEAQAAIEKRARRSAGKGKAKNIVFFLGDGMSIPTLAAARTLLGQRQGRTGEESELSFESFPSVGLSKTYCVNHQIADSACSATAYLCGVKNNYGTLGLTAAVARHDCEASLDASTHLESIAAWAIQDGRDAGVVTNTRITHASPAGLYAKAANRNWERDEQVTAANVNISSCPDIAHQLIHHYPGNEFKVILGGGRREFYPNTIRDDEDSLGRRTDDRNLVEEWFEEKRSRNATYEYLWNRSQLKDALNNPPDYILGLFEDTHIPYHAEANNETEPTLAEMTELAIKTLQRNENGFFLFVESGRIDHAHHDNYVELALDETIRLSDAVTVATELLSEEDSLIVVTADHAHVMAFNGYTQRGGSIVGRSDYTGQDGVPYMTISYANGPGARAQTDGVRVDVTAEENFGDLRWRSHAEVPLSSETHGGDDVGVFARGPHHDLFTGVYEQSQLPHLMAYAGCFGPGAHACNAAPVLANTIAFTSLLVVLLAIQRFLCL